MAIVYPCVICLFFYSDKNHKHSWFKGADSFKITFPPFYKGNTTFHRNCLKYREIYRKQKLPIILLSREQHIISLDPNGMQLPFYKFPKIIFSICRGREPPNSFPSNQLWIEPIKSQQSSFNTTLSSADPLQGSMSKIVSYLKNILYLYLSIDIFLPIKI